jgi:hypothetical protein
MSRAARITWFLLLGPLTWALIPKSRPWRPQIGDRT